MIESFQIGYPIIQTHYVHPLEVRNKLAIELFQIRFCLRLYPGYFTQCHHTGKNQVFDTLHRRNPFCPEISLYTPETIFLFRRQAVVRIRVICEYLLHGVFILRIIKIEIFIRTSNHFLLLCSCRRQCIFRPTSPPGNGSIGR